MVSEQDPVRLFATHVWEPTDDYLRLFEYLEATEKFFYINCSPTEPAPAEDATKEQKNAMLRKQIEAAEAVIVLPGAHALETQWIELEMHMAWAARKPLIAIEPFGPEPLADVIREKVDAVVDWNSRSIVDAILHYARHEETGRWDMIEFE